MKVLSDVWASTRLEQVECAHMSLAVRKATRYVILFSSHERSISMVISLGY